MTAKNAIMENWPEIKFYASMGDGVIYADSIPVLTGNHEGCVAQEPGWNEQAITRTETWPLPRLQDSTASSRRGRTGMWG